jgi:hypothetical protein
LADRIHHRKVSPGGQSDDCRTVHGGGYPNFIPSDGRVRGIDALDVFEACAEAAARHVANRAAL